MENSTTPQDSAAMPPASAGSVAQRDIVADACRWFDERGKDRRQTHHAGCHTRPGHEACLVSRLVNEIKRLRLTDAEREAIESAAEAFEYDDGNLECGTIAATLRGLLERLG